MTKRYWRYQPVWGEDPGGRWFGLCEVSFDKDDNLTGWTESPFCHPQGETMEELSRDLTQMIMDKYRWKPVKFDDLKPGMRFERAIDQETMNDIADLVDQTNDSLKKAQAALH